MASTVPRRVAGSTMGTRPAMTRWHGVWEELGQDGPDRWAPSVSDGGTVMGGRPAHGRRWAKAL
jgi:hypothetical protein